MTFLDPESMKLILSTQILPRCTNPELYLRHRSILASGKVISALCQVAKDHQRRLPEELGDAAMESITQTCIYILEERFWRSFGGDPMRIAVCHFIQDLSLGGFPLLDAVVDRWLKALRECLASADSNVQQSAISAVTALIGDYFRHQPVEKLTALLNHFLPEVTSNNQQARVGNALALGSMPRFLLTVSLPKVIQQLCTCALITDKTLQWAESRKNALTALSLVCTTVGIAPSSPVKMTDGLIFIYFEISLNFIYYYTGGVDQVTLAGIFRTFIDGFEDYTVDSRGDIGAIVRESAMYSIQVLTNTSQPDLLEADLIRSVLHAVAKQSTEQIRRNRLLAPNFFSSLVYWMVRNNPWKAYHSLMLSCLMLLQVVNSKHRTIRNQSGWEEETGVEIPASKSTVLRGHESEVFICLRLNPTTFRRVELKFRATKMSPHLTATKELEAFLKFAGQLVGDKY
ncbi:hypothetical protein DAPPUDRAFT_118178 [Daphnia pulex]|uniref:Tubulin-specific chaperone D n=1 Tax=Daphnia pulex TaxID=6669 RepID=E9HUZ1_DAPPU|nr:hypothetical protein DAPPUDRAFT_118178 [Daphnia pulex]|eukprot:EFX64435.1 hypothetical protein DAPPUDRAFT_118178 [Daphnia pulex]